jgi:hypothetical protein
MEHGESVATTTHLDVALADCFAAKGLVAHPPCMNEHTNIKKAATGQANIRSTNNFVTLGAAGADK